MRAFGMNRYSGNRDKQAIVGQVRIHMAEGPSPFARPESFVVELAVRGGRDRLLLACIDPEPTLRETWESVRDATRGPGEAAENDTVLAIPKLNFDVLHRFAELERAPAGLIAAFQRTQFRLDETGARLRSEAYAKQEALARTQFVFDRPFLIALIQKGAKRPYFLLWIANDELLTPE